MEIKLDLSALQSCLDNAATLQPKVIINDSHPDVKKARKDIEKVMIKLGLTIAECLNNQCNATFPNGKQLNLKQVFHLCRFYVKVKGSLGKQLIGGNKFQVPTTFTEADREKVQKMIDEGSPIIRLSLLEINGLPREYYKAALSGVNSIKSLNWYLSWERLEYTKLQEEDFSTLSPLAQLRILDAFDQVTVSKAHLEQILMAGLFKEKDLVEKLRNKYRKVLGGV